MRGYACGIPTQLVVRRRNCGCCLLRRIVLRSRRFCRILSHGHFVTGGTGASGDITDKRRVGGMNRITAEILKLSVDSRAYCSSKQITKSQKNNTKNRRCGWAPENALPSPHMRWVCEVNKRFVYLHETNIEGGLHSEVVLKPCRTWTLF